MYYDPYSAYLAYSAYANQQSQDVPPPPQAVPPDYDPYSAYLNQQVQDVPPPQVATPFWHGPTQIHGLARVSNHTYLWPDSTPGGNAGTMVFAPSVPPGGLPGFNRRGGYTLTRFNGTTETGVYRLDDMGPQARILFDPNPGPPRTYEIRGMFTDLFDLRIENLLLRRAGTTTPTFSALLMF